MSLGSVAVVGGGINGICIAWELAKRGWEVELFERGQCLRQTSSASTKLLHGGLRYIEQGHFGLVAESLRERARWLRDVPQHTRWLPLLLPIYGDQQRPSWQWRLGLGLYDSLALGRTPGFAQWVSPTRVQALYPQLSVEGLQGAWQFWDGQMDEQGLGQWVLDQARRAGVKIHEFTLARTLSEDGHLSLESAVERAELCFDWVVNACGPWAVRLLQRSGLKVDVRLDLVRGCHLLLPLPQGTALPSQGLFVEVPSSRRIAFLLPYQGELLVGTTEVKQDLDDPIAPNEQEQECVLGVLERYIPQWVNFAHDQGRWIAGLRPIVSMDPSASWIHVSRRSREAVFRRHGRVISVFGGKWTTARALAENLLGRSPFNGQP